MKKTDPINSLGEVIPDTVSEQALCREKQGNFYEAVEMEEIKLMTISEAERKVGASDKTVSDTYVNGIDLIVSENVEGVDLAVSTIVSDVDLAVNANVDSISLDGVNKYVDSIKEAVIDGRRIVDIGFVLNQIHKTFDDHSQETGCYFRDWKLVNTRRRGFLTQLFFRCQTCNHTDNMWSERIGAENLDVNSGAIVGTLVVGIGFAQLEKLCASMSVPCMSEKTYNKYREGIVEQYSETALTQMKLAGEAEKKLAIKRGDIHCGIPYIPVVVDGSWMKRSYGTNYDSLSGVGVIVGYHTRKVLFVGIRNKFCSL